MLTRDRALLLSRNVTHGCYVHARRPAAQLQEIVRRLDLGARMRPFTLCLHCNLALRPVDKAEVIERLPTAVAERHEQFTFCADCRRVYWEGSHWERMRALLRDSLAPGYWAAEPPGSGRTTPGASGISSTTTARST